MDGYKRKDDIKSRKQFSERLPPPLCSGEHAATLPPNARTQKKLVLFYLNKSIFNTNVGANTDVGNGR